MKTTYGVIIVFIVFIIFMQSFSRPRSGFGGLSPLGGERNPSLSIGSSIEQSIGPSIGWWGGEITQVTNTIQYIYDDGTIPEMKTWDVGWWG